eukprot:1490773-Pleurochrysis_carterae.AAC.1
MAWGRASPKHLIDSTSYSPRRPPLWEAASALGSPRSHANPRLPPNASSPRRAPREPPRGAGAH